MGNCLSEEAKIKEELYMGKRDNLARYHQSVYNDKALIKSTKEILLMICKYEDQAGKINYRNFNKHWKIVEQAERKLDEKFDLFSDSFMNMEKGIESKKKRNSRYNLIDLMKVAKSNFDKEDVLETWKKEKREIVEEILSFFDVSRL